MTAGWQERLQSIRERGAGLAHTLVLSDGEDSRTHEAVARLLEEGGSRTELRFILMGNGRAIRKGLAAHSNSLLRRPGAVEVVDPAVDSRLADFTELYLHQLARLGKALPPFEEARRRMARREWFAAMLVATGAADGMLGGAASPTADLIRAGLEVVGLRAGSRVVSGAFVMYPPRPLPAGQEALVFADCAVVPDPDAEQLAAIAADAARVAESVVGVPPVVAFVSFSSKGSAAHPSLDKIRRAVEIMRAAEPNFAVDGELQADAAIVPEVALRKDPQGMVRGRANVLIFPDLNAGNIAYKLVERIAGAKALGVILSGFAKPVNDLSRGCRAEDILDMICVTSLQAAECGPPENRLAEGG